MKRISLLSKDASLRKELAELLPLDYKLAGGSSADQYLVIFDIDTLKPGGMKELGDAHLVIAVTRRKKTATVMEATTFGAYEILLRPLKEDILLDLLRQVEALSDEIKDALPVTTLSPTPTCVIVGHSPIILDVCKKLARLSQVDAPVLITGETGTGKELVAESITQLSSRFGKPFVVVNCAAVPENLLEAELFGFEKGSFTGAVSSKEGLLRIADEGCVFFDEVGELPSHLQGKLLRFLQTQTFYPIGSTKEVHVNVRVISATNRDLTSMVREGKFREDLYHRLRVTSIHIPPLRERKKDILPLVHFFVDRYKHTGPRQVKGITKEFLGRLVSYDWPGNIRELENAIRSAIVLGKTPYLTTHELRELGSHPPGEGSSPAESLASVLVPMMKKYLQKKERNIFEKIHAEVDKTVIAYILSLTKDNQSEAARILGINRLTLRKKIGISGT